MANETNSQAKWYVVHTYSGYENKVKSDIEKIAANRNMQDQIVEALVPTVEVMEERKDGTMVPSERKVYPSYVYVKMVMNPNTWYIVRNTRGVTGFLGPDGSQPTPLSPEEVENIMKLQPFTAFEIGETVMIKEGPMEGSECTITDIDVNAGTLCATLFMMGHETPVELKLSQVKKL